MNRLRALPITTLLFLLALFLRLIPVFIAIDLPIGLDDMFQYDMLARSLAAGNGFRWYAPEDIERVHSFIDIDFISEDYDPRGFLTSFRAPAYPAFLAAIYSMSGLGLRLFAGRLGNALLGATLAPMTYALARRLFPEKEQIAFIAGHALAFYPMLLLYPLALATENLFIPAVLAGLLTLLKAAASRKASHFALAGALFGLAPLTRSVIFIFVGLAILWIWFAINLRRGAIIFTLTMLAFVLPWTIRNTLLHDRFTFVENSMGYNLHMGYHPEGDGSFQFGISLELIPYLDDSLRNELGTEAGLNFIREDPARVPQLMLNKLGYFFSLERRALTYFYSNNFFGAIPAPILVALFLLFTLPFAIVCVLAAFGLPFVTWNKDRLLVLLLLAGYLLPHVLLLAEDRFHLALVPMLAVFAAHAWVSRGELKLAARKQPLKLALALLLVSLLCLNWVGELRRDASDLAILFGPEGNTSYFSY
jgi:hypothetical protein